MRPGLLVDGEQRLERPVLRRRVEQQRQSRGHAYAAIGAQRRTLGTNPAILDTRAYRVTVEVELHVAALLAHHVHVRLQRHRRYRLASRRGGYAHHHITRIVAFPFEGMAAGKVNQILYDQAFAFRRARHTGDGIKLHPHPTGFQIFQGHIDIYFRLKNYYMSKTKLQNLPRITNPRQRIIGRAEHPNRHPSGQLLPTPQPYRPAAAAITPLTAPLHGENRTVSHPCMPDAILSVLHMQWYDTAPAYGKSRMKKIISTISLPPRQVTPILTTGYPHARHTED